MHEPFRRSHATSASIVAASALMALSTLSTPQAAAQNYPVRPVRMIVANGPGSAPDVIARLLGTNSPNHGVNHWSSTTGPAPLASLP